MKAGAYIAFYAMRHIIRQGKETPLPVTFMYIPEEEVGSPTSRDMIVEEAKKTNMCSSPSRRAKVAKLLPRGTVGWNTRSR